MGVLAPVEFADLPDPLHDRLGTAEAAAQLTTVQPGRPNACPAGYTPDVDLCRIEQPACPYSPLDPTRLMQRSTEFIEFCEETVTQAANPVEYATCAAPLPGYTVMDDGTSCRLLQLRSCEVGTRIDSEWCRATIRRSWTCTHLADAVPRNEFNSCYVPPTGIISPAAACGAGAPDLVVIDCADYVGIDFAEPPGSVACSLYDTGTAPAMTNSANPYWCQFEVSYLKAVCHSATPPLSECTTSTPLCLKRASGTGGCDGIAKVIFCRDLQQDYAELHTAALADNTLTFDEEQSLRSLAHTVRGEVCEPCQILPFEPVPQHCPDDTRIPATPYRYSDRHPRIQAIEQEHDIEMNRSACSHLDTWRTDLGLTMINPNTGADCAAEPTRCETPSPGNPVWSSTHFSGAAVVNASVIVRLHDAPLNFREYPNALTINSLISGNITFRREYAEFPGSGLAPTDQLIRTFQRSTTNTISSVAILGNLSNECIVKDFPLFKLVVEELWPDYGPEYVENDPDCVIPLGGARPGSDAEAILRLFGPDSLEWWCELSEEERRGHTESRSLPWWPDLTTSADRDARIDLLKTKIQCHTDQNILPWCRWTPARSGYYRLKVAGGWQMGIGAGRGWISSGAMANLSNRVQNLTQQQQQQVHDSLALLGCGPRRPVDPSCLWAPAAVGLQNDLSDIIWPTGDPEELYRTPTEQQKYPGIDLRVHYSDYGETAKYTETQEFGVQVHEVRVSTVTPSR